MSTQLIEGMGTVVPEQWNIKIGFRRATNRCVRCLVCTGCCNADTILGEYDHVEISILEGATETLYTFQNPWTGLEIVKNPSHYTQARFGQWRLFYLQATPDEFRRLLTFLEHHKSARYAWYRYLNFLCCGCCLTGTTNLQAREGILVANPGFLDGEFVGTALLCAGVLGQSNIEPYLTSPAMLFDELYKHTQNVPVLDARVPLTDRRWTISYVCYTNEPHRGQYARVAQ